MIETPKRPGRNGDWIVVSNHPMYGPFGLTKWKWYNPFEADRLELLITGKDLWLVERWHDGKTVTLTPIGVDGKVAL